MGSIIFKKGPFEKRWTRDDGQSQTHVTEKAVNLEILKLINAGWYMNSWSVGIFTRTRTVAMTNRATRGYGVKS